MEHISGAPRQQITLFPDAIDNYIGQDNPVRFLDAYADSLDTFGLGFEHATVAATGRRPYHPKDLLKLYLYGYLNRIRSSRMLERETQRNVEVFWLLKRLSPDHKTIADFRKDNPTALKGVFQHFVQTCRRLQLFGAELVAIDSTKLTASNARDRVRTNEQLEGSIARINESIGHYLRQLDETDQADEAHSGTCPPLSREQLQTTIAALHNEHDKLSEAQARMQTSGERHVSLTDPDCRLIKDRHGIEPAYRMQTAIDSKHSLIVELAVTSDAADNNHLSPMAVGAKHALGVDHLTVCADAGYYDTVDLKTCDDNAITTYVPVPAQKVPARTKVPAPAYYHDRFVYDPATDSFRCPAGHTLHRWTVHPKSDGRRTFIYRTTGCRECSVRTLCTTSPRGRYVYRWEYEDVLNRLKERLARSPDTVKRRKAIVEHPFGTLKGGWNFRTFLVRGLLKVTGEVSLMALAYNIRRVLNILGTEQLRLQLQQT